MGVIYGVGAVSGSCDDMVANWARLVSGWCLAGVGKDPPSMDRTIALHLYLGLPSLLDWAVLGST